MSTSSRLVLTPLGDSHLNTASGCSKSIIPTSSLRNWMTRSASSILERPPQKSDRSEKAKLAATKLKLRLRMALYKLQQREAKGINKIKRLPNAICALASMREVSIRLKDKFGKNNRVKRTVSFSVPANLRSNSTNDSLKKLKLFQIKRESLFYTSPKSKLKYAPACRANSAPGQQIQHSINLGYHSAANTSANTSANSVNTSANSANNSHHLGGSHPSLVRSATTDSNNLPPINKILETPLRKSRSLSAEDTIDENSTILEKGSDDNNDTTVLTSSPFLNSLGTPNSFSVAKSLLQLGGYKY